MKKKIKLYALQALNGLLFVLVFIKKLMVKLEKKIFELKRELGKI